MSANAIPRATLLPTPTGKKMTANPFPRAQLLKDVGDLWEELRAGRALIRISQTAAPRAAIVQTSGPVAFPLPALKKFAKEEAANNMNNMSGANDWRS
eukprot:g6948.t1